MLRFPECALETIEGLEDDDFSSEKNRIIFQSITENIEQGFDPLTLSNALKEKGWEIPPSELLILQDEYFDGIPISRYKERIKAASQGRNFERLLAGALKDLKTGADPIEIRDRISEGIPALRFGGSEKTFIKKPSDFIHEIQHHGTEQSKVLFYTGLKSFDDLLGGCRPTELSAVTGETSSGKTTFAAAFIPFCISQRGHAVLIASFEMKPPAIVRKMIQMTKGRPLHELKEEEIDDAFDFISDLPIYFIDTYGEMGLKELKACIYRAKKEFDVEFIVLDHLHFFLKYNAEFERQAIDTALRTIKSWAMDLGVHIALVVHPTKLTYDNSVVRLNDLKGSSGLKQIPDNVFSIWRDRSIDTTKNPKNEIVLYVLKVRDDQGDEGKVILTFDKRSQSYSDSGPGVMTPAEGRVSPDSSSPSSRIPSGRDRASGYDQ